jgi:hypothetical protein
MSRDTRTSMLDAFAGDPAMQGIREHAGWKNILATMLALAFCVSIFFSQPEPGPARVAMDAAAAITP